MTKPSVDALWAQLNAKPVHPVLAPFKTVPRPPPSAPSKPKSTAAVEPATPSAAPPPQVIGGCGGGGGGPFMLPHGAQLELPHGMKLAVTVPSLAVTRVLAPVAAATPAPAPSPPLALVAGPPAAAAVDPREAFPWTTYPAAAAALQRHISALTDPSAGARRHAMAELARAVRGASHLARSASAAAAGREAARSSASADGITDEQESLLVASGAAGAFTGAVVPLALSGRLGAPREAEATPPEVALLQELASELLLKPLLRRFDDGAGVGACGPCGPCGLPLLSILGSRAPFPCLPRDE